jgi:hypothetical protein
MCARGGTVPALLAGSYLPQLWRHCARLSGHLYSVLNFTAAFEAWGAIENEEAFPHARPRGLVGSGVFKHSTRQVVVAGAAADRLTS